MSSSLTQTLKSPRQFEVNKPDNLLKAKTIEVDGRRHYVVDGATYPSVTTFIGEVSDNSWLDEWERRVGKEKAAVISRNAANRGTRLHSLMERYIQGQEIVLAKEYPDAVGLFNKLRPLLDQKLGVIRCQEDVLLSHTLKLAGRVDLLAEWEGELSVIDFKTATKPKLKEDIGHYFLQCTAYSYMAEHCYQLLCPKLVVLVAVEDGTIQEFTEHRTNYRMELRDKLKQYYGLE